MNQKSSGKIRPLVRKVLIVLAVLGVAILAGLVIYFQVFESGVAEPLTYVVIPAEEAGLTQEQFSPFVDYLSSRIGRPVELMVVTDYAAVIEAMKYGHADLARFGPFAYVLATEEAEVEALVVGIKEKTGRPSYRSLIVALASSGIEDLNGASLAYVDVGSASGYLAPSTFIMKSGIRLKEEFFAGSHSAVIEAVRNGTVDAGCIADNRYDVAVAENVISPDDFEIIWASEPIPNTLIAVQESMDPMLRDAVRSAFLEAPEGLVRHLGVGESGYVPAFDSDYDVIREIQAAHEQTEK
jgi:phosphonate transport system substrate-binding protein